MASHHEQAGQGSDSSNQLQMKREEYGNKASETASHASNTTETKKEEYTNRGHEAASEAGNKAGETKDSLMNKAIDATESAKDNNTVQAAQTYAIELKDQASTLLHQTGEQVKNIAAGAAESIKSTWSGINTTTDNNNSGNPNNAATASGGGNNADSPLINPNHQLSSSTGNNSDSK